MVLANAQSGAILTCALTSLLLAGPALALRCPVRTEDFLGILPAVPGETHFQLMPRLAARRKD